MTQTATIAKHLRKHRSITPLEALSRYRVMRLAARIAELRPSMPIRTEIVEKGGKRFARYRLAA